MFLSEGGRPSMNLGEPPIYRICSLAAPYRAVPSPPRKHARRSRTVQLLTTGPLSILQIRLKAGLEIGAVIAAPICLGHSGERHARHWTPRERRSTIPFSPVHDFHFSSRPGGRRRHH